VSVFISRWSFCHPPLSRPKPPCVFSQAEKVDDVEKIRVEFLGKKGRLTDVLKTLGKLPKEARPLVGAAINTAKAEVEALIAEAKTAQKAASFAAEMAADELDVTMPGLPFRAHFGHTHPLTSTIEKAVDVFLALGYELVDGADVSPEVEDEYYCFEALNCPEDHPARDMQDTFYIDEPPRVTEEGREFRKVLRTHTSSVQIRHMENNKPPYAIIAPGRVFRRDSTDATHSMFFHQVEILHLGKDLTLGDLKATVTHFLQKMFGKDIKVRFRGSFFPFTEPSMEVDVYFRGKWLEVLGCGMVDPRVLEKAGIDPDEFQGFAAGFGIERFAMVIHQIPDIREFYVNDYRFLRQFNESIW